MAKACLKSKSFSLKDRQYRAVIRHFIWSLNPDYMITVNPNYGGSDKRKYRQQRPSDSWLKNFDAVLNSRLVQRRVSRLLPGLRVSFLVFPEFTKDGYLHFHILLALPKYTAFSNSALSKRQIQHRVRKTIEQVLLKFFRGASVKVKAIWSKGAVDYTTKCFHRSSEIDWTYWRKPLSNHDATRLNTFINSSFSTHYDDTKALIPGIRNGNESDPCLPPTAGIVESQRTVGRREIVSLDHSTSAYAAVDAPPTSHSARRLSLRSYSYRFVVATVYAACARWLRMGVADG